MTESVFRTISSMLPHVDTQEDAVFLFWVSHHEAMIILNIFCYLAFIKQRCKSFEMFMLCFCVSKTRMANKGVGERASVDRSAISRSAHKTDRMHKKSLHWALIPLLVMGSYAPISLHCVHVCLQHNISSSL